MKKNHDPKICIRMCTTISAHFKSRIKHTYTLGTHVRTNILFFLSVFIYPTPKLKNSAYILRINMHIKHTVAANMSEADIRRRIEDTHVYESATNALDIVPRWYNFDCR